MPLLSLMFKLLCCCCHLQQGLICYAQAKPCISASTILRASVDVTW